MNEQDLSSFYKRDIVSVIASFDVHRHIRPLYVRIGEKALKIKTSWEKSSFSGAAEFCCEVIADDRIYPVTLRFYYKECLWTIKQER